VKLFALLPALLGVMLQFPLAVAQSIPVIDLKQMPQLDAEPNEWGGYGGEWVALTPLTAVSRVEARQVLVKVGRYADQVLFYFEWQDTEADLVHKPFRWNAAEQRYARGEQREDRLAIQFQISGEYHSDWLATGGFVADMWHWKASRSNPLGLAHDKKTTLSRAKILRAYRTEKPDGTPLYILRESDQGTPLYTTARYGRRVEAQMPKYLLASDPRGSIADVRAKGVWRDGWWRLELLRKLDTGHGDDVVFVAGQAVAAGIAIFDQSENEDHVVSSDLEIRF